MRWAGLLAVFVAAGSVTKSTAIVRTAETDAQIAALTAGLSRVVGTLQEYQGKRSVPALGKAVSDSDARCGKDTEGTNQMMRYPFRGFQLSHLLKAGGTFAHGITNGAVERSRNTDHASNEAIWTESTWGRAICRGCRYPGRHKIDYEMCGADPSAPLFVIQLVREPCSYYASVYGFQTRSADHAMPVILNTSSPPPHWQSRLNAHACSFAAPTAGLSEPLYVVFI